MCAIRPTNKPISAVRIKKFLPINSAAALNVSPPSFKKIHALIPQWTRRKATKDRPVIAIMSFLPSELDKFFVTQDIFL
jgi:hypothetical protein